MTDKGPINLIPQVTSNDLFNVEIEDLLDPTHSARWKKLIKSNPELARHILEMATRAKLEGEDTGKAAVDIATFAVMAVVSALNRIEKTPYRSTSFDDDDAGQRP